MLKNYLKIAVRTLRKNSAYAFINIFGLSVGITCAILIFFYVQSELTFDAFHSKSDRIYRIIETNSRNPEDVKHYGQTSPGAALAMQSDIPGIELTTNAYSFFGHRDTFWKGKKMHERNTLVGDENFFKVFDFEFIYGDSKTALSQANSIVFTESLAKKYFGNENPIGQTMSWNEDDPVKVTGVIKDIPDNSHISFTFIESRNTAWEFWAEYEKTWEDYGAHTYVVLEGNSSKENIEKNIPQLITKHLGENPRKRGLYLQPVTDIYFGSSEIQYAISDVQGNKFYVNLFIGIGIFILVVVCINYINLATAKASFRAKEIGLRKVTGASKSQLITQFLMEAVVLAVFSFVISILLLEVLIPHFNNISGKSFDLNIDSLMGIGSTILGMTIGLGLMAGIYPAFVLSNLQPVQSLKGDVKSDSYNLRRVLVIAQFSISIVMLVGTLIVYDQMQYIQGKELGFNKENMLIVDINSGNVRRNFQTMKQEFLAVPGVQKVAATSRVPGEWKNISRVSVKPQLTATDSLDSYFMCFDDDAIDTYGFKMIAGSYFSGNKNVDSLKVVLNESAVKALNLENPVGQTINMRYNGATNVQVIGVIKDFHYQSLHQKINPLVIGYWANPVRPIDYFSLRVSDKNLEQTMAGINAVHEKFDSSTAMESHFLDSQLNLFYVNDKRVGELLGIGAILMIIIAGFGLLGLTSYMIEKRKKEIGVRKVLGSTAMQLVLLLFKSYGKQILIAFGIAVPIGWYFASEWSNYFAFSGGISIWLFLLAGTLVLIFTFLTVGYRVIKAALLNPVDVLKDE